VKSIRNKTQRPLRISLPGGKALHLGPGKTGQVADDAVERESFRKLVKSGTVEILGDGHAGPGGGTGNPAVQTSTHGHRTSKVVKPKGDR